MRLLIAGVTALALTSGVALAQTATESSSSTTTQDTTAPAAPPAGVLSTTHKSHAQDSYGDSRDSKSTTYRDGNGVSKESSSRTTQVAPMAPPPVTSSTSTSSQTTTTIPPQ